MHNVVRAVKLNCALSCTQTPTLKLNNIPVSLSTQDGINWTGSMTVQVSNLVDIHCRAVGVEGEAWSLAITTDCPAGGTTDKVFTSPSNAKIPAGGSFEFYAAGKVPETLCAGKGKV